VIIELARHADDRRLVQADVLPAVIDARGNNDQPLITRADQKLVDAATGRRFRPAIEADDAQGAARGEQPINGIAVDPPAAGFPGKRDRQINLGNGVSVSFQSRRSTSVRCPL
jgi:hypothetical protein